MTGSVNSYTTNYKFKLINFNTGPWHDLEWANWREVDALIYTYFNISNVQGIWANSTAYTVGQRVIDDVVSRVFQCDVDHTSAASPTTFAQDRVAHATYWSDIGVAPEYVGAWATATDYLANQYITNGHQYAVCTTDHTSGTYATDVTSGYWEILADLTTSVDAAAASASAASASELAAAASETAAGVSASSAANDAGLTAADAIATAADRIAVAADKATVIANAATVAADVITVAADKATVAADKATVAADKIAAAASAFAADASADAAALSEAAAAASAASINLPASTGKALNFLRQNAGETALEYRTPTQVRSDIGAGTGSGDMVASAYPTLVSLEGLSRVAGDILYATAADTLVRLAKGTDGQVLTLASGIPSWATAAGGGKLTLIQSQTASSSASLAFTTGIDSTYSRYVIIIDQLIPATTGANLTLRAYLNGSWNSTYYAHLFHKYSSTQSSQARTADFFLTRDDYGTAVAGEGTSGEVWIVSPSVAGKKKHVHGNLHFIAGAGVQMDMDVSGYFDDTTYAATGFKLVFDTGNIASGTATLYGVAKA
jgi:hypothetical protein